MSKKFYVTTAIDYTDDVIHIGHAYQKIVADVVARYHLLLGKEVFFLTGTDEHGGKVENAAEKAGELPKDFADRISAADQKELDSLNISYNRFIRTTDPDHIEIVNGFWKKVKAAGDIYAADYEGLYCGGCEGYITESDLVDGKCPYHPTKKLQTLKEKNYFFRWSKYQEFLEKYIKNHPEFVQPESRRNEMLAFLDRGLKDIPISREKLKWGIPVPGDPSQVIYVWFDALINYISGAPEGFWPADLHLLGKDNTRWHALLWPAMLKSAGLELPKTIYAHGFISLEGKKISKSIGNIIRPSELVQKFGVDAVRYYLLRIKNFEDDGDLSLDKLTEVYNADLANGLGNLVSRVAKLCEKSELKFFLKNQRPLVNKNKKLEEYKFNEALGEIWQKIATLDKIIDTEKPWKLTQNEELRIKNKGPLEETLQLLVAGIREIAVLLEPFLPETSQKIQEQFAGPEIKAGAPLFPRIKKC